MKFDTVIIGGGLSGLICGIRLSQQGQKCVIISSGQSALHFFSGSFDLLNSLPNGDDVDNPVMAVDNLIEQAPEHPYAKIGKGNFAKLVIGAQDFFTDIGLRFRGNAYKNHFRITPMGTLKPTWLSASGFAYTQTADKLPWKKVAIFNPLGFLDFYPQFVADEFIKLGTESDIHLFNLADLDELRRNPSEMRSTNIARILDKNIDRFAQILEEKSGMVDAIVLPACFGLKREIFVELENKVNKPIFQIPTMPPSIVGINTQQYLHDYFLKLGGVYMLGDNVKKAELDGKRVGRIYSFNHGDIPFKGENVILATGSYFSQGLIATSESIYEPIFNLDVAYSGNRNDWYNKRIFEPQGYQSYGVITDEKFRGIYKGETIENLYVSGAILNGFNPMKEGSGAGVSILTALSITNTILENRKG